MPLMTQLWVLIAKIPLCGGYTVASQSPEATCLRRFSNEATVPQPCLKRRCCRAVFEHSAPLRAFGKVGTAWCEARRAPIMLTAFAFSLLGWAFTIAACAAYTADDATVARVNWGYGEVAGGSLRYYIGLKRVVFEQGAALQGFGWGKSDAAAHAGVCGESVAFDSPYTAHGPAIGSGDGSTGTPSYNSTPATSSNGDAWVMLEGMPVVQCAACRAIADRCVRLAIVSSITQVFQITTDLQRTTRYGDLNCQKAFGFCTSMYGGISAYAALVRFRRECGLLVSIIPPWGKTTAVAVNVADTGAHTTIDVHFRPGPGYILLFLAVCFKALDALAHLAVPTPASKHGPPPGRPIALPPGEGGRRVGGEAAEDDPYERLADYMRTSVGGQQHGGGTAEAGSAAEAANMCGGGGGDRDESGWEHAGESGGGDEDRATKEAAADDDGVEVELAKRWEGTYDEEATPLQREPERDFPKSNSGVEAKVLAAQPHGPNAPLVPGTDIALL